MGTCEQVSGQHPGSRDPCTGLRKALVSPAMSNLPPPGGPQGGYPGGQPPYGSGQQPPPPQQPWGGPPPGGPPGGGGYGYGGIPQDHPRGTLILILGILSIPCCGLFTGIPAWVMGHTARQEIQQNPGAYSNAGMVTAGWVCGIIGTVLSVVGIIIQILVIGASPS